MLWAASFAHRVEATGEASLAPTVAVIWCACMAGALPLARLWADGHFLIGRGARQPPLDRAPEPLDALLDPL